MIGIEAFSAVFSDDVPGLMDLPGVVCSGRLEESKTESACAHYAVEAVSRLSPENEGLGLITVSGPTGTTVKAFDKAWSASKDGRLTGPEFGARRSRRIHPFTLIKSLQNQTPANLSLRFGIKGPCLNFLDTPTSLAFLLPNAAAMLDQRPKILLVLAAADDREEERTKRKALHPKSTGIEGAACFLLTRRPGLGYLEAAELEWANNESIRDAPLQGSVLQGGIALLRCLADKTHERVIVLQDWGGRRAAIRWRKL